MVKTNEKVTYRPTDVLDGLAAEENMEPVHPLRPARDMRLVFTVGKGHVLDISTQYFQFCVPHVEVARFISPFAEIN